MLSSFFQNFDLFFLDLDGLLINTEHLHYQAFISASRDFGYRFSFDFSFYLEHISKGRNVLKNVLISSYPNLNHDWELLYRRKEELYILILMNNDVDFMPGAEIFIKKLLYLGKDIAVITNSNRSMVSIIKSKNILFQEIKKWVVREDYNLPKPYPDSYMRAKELYVRGKEKVVCFEDSLKGIISLKEAFLFGVLVNSSDVIRNQGQSMKVMVLKSLKELFY